MSISTGTGDEGMTSLGDGTRVSKSSARVEAYGSVDEANSAVGFARVAVSDTYLEELLRFIQHRLSNCTSTLASPQPRNDSPTPIVTADDVAVLEVAVDRLETRVGSLSSFVVESGCESAARLYVARATVRRAERRVVALAELEPVAENVLAFLNRTSDVLFSGARCANALAGSGDEPWDAACEAPGTRD